MPSTQRSTSNLTLAQKSFNGATSVIGGLYLTTHSITVTLIGAGAGISVTGWTIWLEYNSTTSTTGTEPTALTADEIGLEAIDASATFSAFADRSFRRTRSLGTEDPRRRDQ